MSTPVMFRVSRRDKSDIFALFPTLPGTNDPNTCSCYQHVGQHSSADYWGCIASSRPATEEERKYLHAELVRVGYDDLKIVSRATRAMREERYAQL